MYVNLLKIYNIFVDPSGKFSINTITFSKVLEEK